jgi:hypothetical protein
MQQVRPGEIEAAQALAPELRARLAPDESAMVVTTSFYAWFAGPADGALVIADERDFNGHCAAPQSAAGCAPLQPPRAARRALSAGHLPRCRLERSDPALDGALFSVRDSSGVALSVPAGQEAALRLRGAAEHELVARVPLPAHELHTAQSRCGRCTCVNTSPEVAYSVRERKAAQPVAHVVA